MSGAVISIGEFFVGSKCGIKGEMILSIYLFLPIQPGYTHSKEVNEVEQQTMLKEILKALDLHASDIRSQIADLNEKFQSLDKKVQSLDDKVQSLDKKVEGMDREFRKKFEEMDKRMQALEDRLESRIDRLENEMNERFDRLETKINHIRMELIETQETVDFHSVKIAQHDRKIRNLSQQQ